MVPSYRHRLRFNVTAQFFQQFISIINLSYETKISDVVNLNRSVTQCASKIDTLLVTSKGQIHVPRMFCYLWANYLAAFLLCLFSHISDLFKKVDRKITTHPATPLFSLTWFKSSSRLLAFFPNSYMVSLMLIVSIIILYYLLCGLPVLWTVVYILPLIGSVFSPNAERDFVTRVIATLCLDLCSMSAYWRHYYNCYIK